MRKIYKIFSFVFFTLTFLAYSAGAAGLTFSADTTVVLGGNNFTIVAGSTAETMSGTGTATLSVTLIGGESFTLASSNRFFLGQSGGVSTCVPAGTNQVTVTGLGTFTFTPNTIVACGVGFLAPGGGGLGSGVGGTVVPPPSPPLIVILPPVVVPLVPPQPIEGCASGNMFSSTTGMSCITPPASVPGCTSNAGFSPVTGQSCFGNTVNTGQVSIAGCSNSNIGFSSVNGQSCAYNLMVASPPVTYDFGTENLRNGSGGTHVMELQRFLNKFEGTTLVVDGKFGPKTAGVVKKWQGENGLVADGIVGPKTKANMYTFAASH